MPTKSFALPAVLALCCTALYPVPSVGADSVLHAAVLSPQQESTFNHQDSTMSEFWLNWSSHDSLLLLPGVHDHPARATWDSTGDAALSVKAAAGERGLYFLAVLTDNRLVEPQGNLWILADAVVLYLDTLTPQAIADCGFCLEDSTGWRCGPCMVGPDFGTLTYSSVALSTWQGGTTASGATHVYQSYGASIPQWQQLAVTTAQLSSLCGWDCKIGDMAAGGRYTECHVPWSGLGLDHAPVGELAGRTLGFTVGYDDADNQPVDSIAQVSSLRWLSTDPWDRGVMSWGALVLPENLGSAAVFRVSSSSQAAQRAKRQVHSRVFYDLQGRRLSQTRHGFGGHGRLSVRADRTGEISLEIR